MPLSSRDRIALRIGGLQFQGWRAGELMLIDDGGHSPDSLTVFDPVRRILFAGDLTYEYNPLWPSGAYGRMIERLKSYRALAAAGKVAMLADSHHQVIFQGEEEIVPVLDRLAALHEERRAAIVKAARENSTKSVEKLRRLLATGDAEFARLIRDHEFPKELCLTRSMIAVALREMDEAQYMPELLRGKEETKMTEQEKNIQIVKEMHAAFGRADLSAVLELLAEDIDWQVPATGTITEVISWAKPRHGRKEVAAFFKELFEKITRARLDIHTITAQDDRVAVEGITQGTAISTGREFRNDWMMAFTFRDGKIARFRQYYDTADVAAAFHTAEEVRPAA